MPSSASSLPPLAAGELADRLSRQGLAVPGSGVERLLAHYDELRRWGRRLSLIGPGTIEGAIDRHYAESLLGASLVEGESLLDVGSGAGFPGLVLAAARPGRRVVLLERRARKAAFLRAAARRMGLDVEVLEGDLREVLSPPLRQQVDSVTLRAVRLDPAEWKILTDGARPRALVVWQGVRSAPPPPEWKEERAVEIEGRHSRIVSYRRQP